MSPTPAAVTLSRGRRIDLGRPDYYQDLLTGIVEEILAELAELEKINLESLGQEDFDQVAGITQIRLLNELYYCLGQLRAQGIDHRGETGHPGPAGLLEPLHRQQQAARRP